MQIINVLQGSPEWHSLRAKHFTASEAPVMMAASSKMRRDELLSMKATGTEREISDWVQTNLFDKGHQQEATARVIVESMIGDELYPATAVDDMGCLLASFDGMTMMEDTLFEHKMWNASLAAAVRQQELPPEYYWQLEQQLLVSGAERVIFVCSDGTEENFASMEYTPVQGRADALIAGWHQFKQDLDSYEPGELKELPQGKSIMRLPALMVEIEGAVKQSNLTVYQGKALAFIESINTTLVTDQDFADAEETVKFCDKAESELDLIKQQALSQTVEIDELFRTIDVLREAMRAKRLELTKLVKSRKEEIRAEIISKAKTALNEHISALNVQLGAVRLPIIPVDFVTAIKGKKTLTSLQGAANDELARAKMEANQICDKYQANLKLFDVIEPALKSLFADINQLVGNDSEHLKLLIDQRISNQKKLDDERIERERLAAAALQAAKAAPTEDPEPVAHAPLHSATAFKYPETLGGAPAVPTEELKPAVMSITEIINDVKADLAAEGIKINAAALNQLIPAIIAGRIRHISANV
ncbi:YqaJ viral recombinase family protein [Serratia proteamaculans]|uniref:YqaJ viral recombinase family protein n=1 Tax=Serratia proteamaculans TaxID=28151 RepID=UPI0039B0B8C1